MSETEKIIDEVLGQLYPNKELPPKSHAKKVLKPIAQDASMYRYFKRVAKEEFGQSLGAIFVLAGEHTLRAAHASEQGAEQLAKEWSNLASKLDADNGRINGCSWKQADTLRECAAQLAALSQRPTPATASEPKDEEGRSLSEIQEFERLSLEHDDPTMVCSKPDSASVGKDAKQLAITFHNIYERLAPDFGYETRKETRDFDQTTPNGRLMIAVCAEILRYHLPAATPSGGGEKWTITESNVRSPEGLYLMEGGKDIAYFPPHESAKAYAIRDAHNATLQPRDCGEDTAKLYQELLYAVEKKHPNESRHQTALRYIQERERGNPNDVGQTDSAMKEQT